MAINADFNPMAVMATHEVAMTVLGDPATFVLLREKLDKAIAEFEALKVAKAPKVSVAPEIEKIKGDAERIAAADKVKATLRKVLASAMDKDEFLCFVLLDTLATLKTEVQGEVDYVKNRKLRNREVAEDPAESDEGFDRRPIEDLKDLIDWAWAAIKLSWIRSEELDTKFPVSETKQGIMPDLPRLPRMPSEDDGSAGRYAAERNLLYRWKGKNLPSDLLLTDVAHDYVSDLKSGYIVTANEIRKAIESTGIKSMFGTKDKPWSFTFPTGKLEGWMRDAE